MGHPSPSLIWSRCSRRACLGALGLLAARRAFAQATAPENQIKAAFLAKFTQYLEWPAHVFTQPEQPIIIGILGEDTFGEAFDESLRAFKVVGRQVQVRRWRRVEDVVGCQMLFISPSENAKLKPILDALRGQPVFTVGDHEDFIKHGGVLRFWRDGDKLAFQINPAALRATEIKAHPKLLKLSHDPAQP
ncbi:MAG: YfiR family protein [Proteobacteria bacterium]|nr:YfiR family protein [Pseudomonadota bacterium]